MNNTFEHSQKYICNPEQADQIRCRICYDSLKPLLSVCGCSGSIAYVHQDCILDWITKKIQSADRVQIPSCQVCHERFSARMKVSSKKLCIKLLLQKLAKTPRRDIIFLIIHLLVFILTLLQIFNFFVSILEGTLIENNSFSELYGKIFTNFICQIYVIFFLRTVVKQKKWIINESMIQIVQVTLKPRIIVKK